MHPSQSAAARHGAELRRRALERSRGSSPGRAALGLHPPDTAAGGGGGQAVRLSGGPAGPACLPDHQVQPLHEHVQQQQQRQQPRVQKVQQQGGPAQREGIDPGPGPQPRPYKPKRTKKEEEAELDLPLVCTSTRGGPAC